MSTIGPLISRHERDQLPDDGKRYELLEGGLLASPSPNQKHQRCIWQLMAFLQSAEHAGYGRGYVAPFDVILDDYNVVEPDVLFIRTEHFHIITEAHVEGAPDLVVEVLSPGTQDRDRGVKAHAYAQFGVEEYWIVDPENQTLTIYRLTAGHYQESGPYESGATITSPVFPGIPLTVERLFQ